MLLSGMLSAILTYPYSIPCASLAYPLPNGYDLSRPKNDEETMMS